MYHINKKTRSVASAEAENHMTAYGTFVRQLLILLSFTTKFFLTSCKHDVLHGSLCLACPNGYDTFLSLILIFHFFCKTFLRNYV